MASMTQANLSLYTVTALLILDSEGNRVLAKYYKPPHQTAPGRSHLSDSRLLTWKSRDGDRS